MKERPILFSSEMVRAILNGRKTMARRVTTPQPRDWTTAPKGQLWPAKNVCGLVDLQPCPYGVPGDRLWVRETWHYQGGNNIEPSPGFVSYRADGEFMDYYKERGSKWRPSIHMPRWASRLTLEVTGVRVERVQEITEEDARAEGIKVAGVGTLERYPRREAFRSLWDTINARRGHGWDTNPWVWVVEFRVLSP